MPPELVLAVPVSTSPVLPESCTVTAAPETGLPQLSTTEAETIRQFGPLLGALHESEPRRDSVGVQPPPPLKPGV